jgi:hypothetical protein
MQTRDIDRGCKGSWKKGRVGKDFLGGGEGESGVQGDGQSTGRGATRSHHPCSASPQWEVSKGDNRWKITEFMRGLQKTH